MAGYLDKHREFAANKVDLANKMAEYKMHLDALSKGLDMLAVLGEEIGDEVLDRIFQEFCIGK